MSIPVFTTGIVLFKKTYNLQFDKSSSLKTKKLIERLESNITWAAHHKFEFRRINLNEFIFKENSFEFLAKSSGQLLMGHLQLDPKNNQFIITGRLNQTAFLFYLYISYVLSTKAENLIFSILTFIALQFFMVTVFKYTRSFMRFEKRYNELASAISDVIMCPNKTFKHSIYKPKFKN